ncbi:MAG: hypothetical protein O3A00_15350 [Planctomycetota bacterium]|nr:hypothetical protein [Planctomycetota bacterium]
MSPSLIESSVGAAPQSPSNLRDLGINEAIVIELLLKAAFPVSQFTTEWISDRLHLPIVVLESILESLTDDHLLQVLGGYTPTTFRYTITDRGREQASRFFDLCGYVGPTPVSLQQYSAMIEWQHAQFEAPTFEAVQEVLSPLTLSENEIMTAALAARSQRSLFVWGPPGNGKTTLAQSLHGAFGGELWIPHAINVGPDVIQLFDEQVHQRVEVPDDDYFRIDRRWVRIKRPMIVAGGEMTIESVDLIYSPTLKMYQAPQHIKANGGTFMIDDFGRQRVGHQELLNRWIIPMEHGVDHLTFRTGPKMLVPFRLMLVVATNLDPTTVMEPAFLRRFGYRMELDEPTRDEYASILHGYAKRVGIEVEEGLVERLLNRYDEHNQERRGCEPRDLIERSRDVCELQGRPFALNDDILSLAWHGYFGEDF